MFVFHIFLFIHHTTILTTLIWLLPLFLHFILLYLAQGNEDGEEEEEEDLEEGERTPVRPAVVLNALDQIRGKAETVYEPFVLQKEDKVHLIFWKCEGFKVVVTG